MKSAVRYSVWGLLSLLGLLLAMGVTVQDRHAVITAVDAQQREWNFLRDHLPKLAPPKRLIALAGQSLDRFPVMLFADAQRPQLIDQEDAVATRRWPPPGRDLMFFQSMACWVAGPDEHPVPHGMHPRCAAVRAHYVVEPVDVTELAGPVGPMLHPTQPSGYEVGFFRLVGVQAAPP